ncbi:MAG: transporter substrate-binding domain-containing protein [Gammaproteobacteria bacterium]|nr:transporter substrate-binding domain-containing protein [Gammaproteobacteria bacterium]
MIRPRTLRALLAITLLLICPQLAARDVSMLTLNWAPHYASDLPEQGLTTALVKAAFRAGGHNAEVEFIPWARALKEVEEGKADVVMGAYYNEERTQKFIFSDVIYHLNLGLIARPGLDKTRYQSLQELSEYSIGVARGFANSEDFDAANYLDKQVASTPRLNIRKLFRGRIDMAVMNFDLFRYEAKKEGFCISDVTFMDPPLSTEGLYVMASRRIADGEQLMQDFNRGLAAIRANGEFDRIVNRFRK